MGDATLYTVLPTHTAAAGVTLASVGILLSANRFIRLLFNGVAGLAYDRWPRRRLFVPALFLGALSTALYAATRGFWPLLAGRLLWGVAWSGIWVGGATMILDVAGAQERGRWTGLYSTWFFIGAAAGTFAGGLLTDCVGYTATMWIGAGLSALGALIALLLLPETRGARRDERPTEGPPLRLRANRGLWVVASCHAVNRFCTAGVLMSTMALIVQDRLSPLGLVAGAATLTGALLAGRTLFSMAAAPLAGLVSDRLASRWTVAAGGLVVGAASMGLMAWDAPGAILTGIALGSISSGSLQALISALTGDLVAPAQRGRAIGLVHTAGDLGSALGPLAAYALLPWVGLTGAYLLCALLFAAQLVPVMWARARHVA